VWSRLLEGVGFYTTGFPESACETFLDVKNPTRDEIAHNNVMEKFLEETNHGTPSQGDSYAFPFFGNIGVHLMATLKIPGLNVGLPIWLWTTLNVPNSLYDSYISTLFHKNRIDVDYLPYSFTKYNPPPFASSGEILYTNNHKSKRNTKMNIKKKKSLIYASHGRGKIPVTAIHIDIRSSTSASHVGDQQLASTIHAGSASPVTTSHTSIKLPASMSHVGYQK
jgi:hypothetical protein